MSGGGNSSSNGTDFGSIISGNAGAAINPSGVSFRAFALNLATGLALFAFELMGFFLLRSSEIGRRIYQPKSYLVQEKLRVEAIPVNPWKWLRRIFTIDGEELKAKCGLDGYFFLRFLRAIAIIFLPLMVLFLPILLPINYIGGKANRPYVIGGHTQQAGIKGLDLLAWQNVAPEHTNRYWAQLICAIIAISYTCYRIYREKLHFIQVRQAFLTSPEHRLKASARTVLVTNIPSDYRSNESLQALFDVFVDNDDRSKLFVWVNRDYKSLRALSTRRRKLCHALEKEELRLLRLVNKQQPKKQDLESIQEPVQSDSVPAVVPEDESETTMKDDYQQITTAFEADCQDKSQLWHRFLKESKGTDLTISKTNNSDWEPASSLKFWRNSPKKHVPKIAWMRAEIARLNVQIEENLQHLDDETRFPRQNSAFIQFDRQMAAHMAYSLTTHHRPGCMSPRFLDVAPHEIVWSNMGMTSLRRFIRTCIALVLFVGMIVLWGIPATFLGILSQLDSVRQTTSWLSWLQPWPDWLISLISGPVASILLALLVQLVVPALCRKLAVLVGAPTRSRREVITLNFYFTFLFIELVLVTSISSGLVATIQGIIKNPSTIANTLATNLPKTSNYFFNYLIIQGLGFSGSVLFQYLRVLYITTIWPWFTQTPREEAWLQTTIPHQMWGNVHGLFTNFAAIGLIYSIIAPMMLFFISALFILFWIAYKHNYYFVQRNKVDTHGLLFDHALSLLFAGIYVMEIALIGLFFLVRDSANNVACSAQAIIMIVALALTGAYHFVLESTLQPLRMLVPVTLEDIAADAERKRFAATGADADAATNSDSARDTSEEKDRDDSIEVSGPGVGSEKHVNERISNDDSDETVQGQSTGVDAKGVARMAANARKTLSRLQKKRLLRVAEVPIHIPGQAGVSIRREAADQLGTAIAGYPDELTDLNAQERDAELKAAYQDPTTREPTPVIWIPKDPAGCSEDAVVSARKYGKHLQYSNAGAFLARNNKCVITQPAPDVAQDWMLQWYL